MKEEPKTLPVTVKTPVPLKDIKPPVVFAAAMTMGPLLVKAPATLFWLNTPSASVPPLALKSLNPPCR